MQDIFGLGEYTFALCHEVALLFVDQISNQKNSYSYIRVINSGWQIATRVHGAKTDSK